MQLAALASGMDFLAMSSSSMKRIRMQSGSWYLGTPGMTVTSLASLRCGAGGSSASPCLVLVRCVDGEGLARLGGSAVSSAESAAVCASSAVASVVFGVSVGRRRVGRGFGSRRLGRLASSAAHRLGRHRLSRTVSATS